MQITCFKCRRTLPGEMFKSQSKSGSTRRTDIPRQCLDCLRAWHCSWAERRRRASGMPLKNDPLRMAASKRRKVLLSTSRQRATKGSRRQRWGQEGILDVYAEAKYMQMEVDHITPLNGALVCGLHAWDNLQLLPAKENALKRNKFDPSTHVHIL